MIGSKFDEKKAEKILKNVHSVVVKLINPVNEMNEFEKLKNFGVEIKHESGEPSIVIEKGETSIVYMATPLQMEFEPFLRTIKRVSENFFDEELKINCNGEVNGELLVFIAPMCPHCAKVVENVNKIAIVNPNIKCKIIDVTLYPDLSERYGITSAPTTVIRGRGNEVKLTGEMEIKEILDWVKKVLCGDSYVKDYYSILLKEGKMEDVLKEVENDEDKLSVIAEIIESSELMTKIGAMLLLEKIYEKNPEKIDKVKDELRKIIESGNSTAIQDAAFILGRIGNEEDLKILKKLLESEDAEIREAAEEAIEEIERKIS